MNGALVREGSMARLVRRVGKVLLGVLGALALLYVGFCVHLRATAPAWLYDRPAHGVPVPPPGAAMLTLRASDGVAVHALELPPPQDGARIVVVCHGNGGSILDWGDAAEALHARGMGVVVLEYRGFAVSSDVGAPSEQGLYRDAEAVIDALVARGIARGRIVLLGESLGTGVAAEMARRGAGGALILISPYTGLLDFETKGIPLPGSLLMQDRFATLAKAPEIRVPTLIIHGDQDEEVPFAMGQRLASAIAGASFHPIAGGHHNDLLYRWSWRDEVVETIATFVAR
jgi:fermentation-respiration switch protein FrsA (DUF1100 family)